MGSRNNIALGVVALGLLVAAVFADVLFVPGDKVPSFSPYGDVHQYYYASRTFAFGELSDGRLPVWNPHIFSGTPCLANFQTAIFYPPNLVYLVLPMARAISLDLAFHVLLFGLFTFAWARNRGQNIPAAFTAGTIAMFSGALMLHVYGGHLTMIAAFAWMPLIMLAVDKLIARPTAGWTMLGVGAVALQILAGLPHVVFITFVTVALYVVMNAPACPRPLRTLPAFAMVGTIPLLLTAVQLLPALHFLTLCAPHGDGSLAFATSFSFPPENLLMLVMPGFWGALHGTPYVGRWQIWEVFFFIGIGGLFLVFMALFRAPFRKNLPLYVLAGILIVLALGRYTPVYEPVFNWVPGFSLFRVPARLLVPASLILAIIAGEGLNALYARPLKSILPALLFIVLAVALAAGALYVHGQASLPQRETTLVRIMEYLTSTRLKNREVASVTPNVRAEFIRAACTALVFAFLLGVVKRFPRATALLAAAVAAEMALFAFPAKSSFHLSELQLPRVVEAQQRLRPNRLKDHPAAINRLFNSGALDIWGCDPLVQRRYTEFVVSVMHVNRPIWKSGDPRFLSGGFVGRQLGLLRLAGLVGAGDEVSSAPCVPLPEFSLITDATVKLKNEVLPAINSPDFKPATEVILESHPNPAPTTDPAASAGAGSILDKSPGYYVLQFEVPTPAILLNTDAYAPGWTVTPLEPSPQQTYDVLPADYVLRAIPLAAGHHKIRLEYVPPLFPIGKIISIATLLLILAAALLKMRTSRKPAKSHSTG